MKYGDLFLVIAGVVVSINTCYADVTYGSLFGTRNERLDKKVQEEVRRQIGEVRGKIKILQDNIEQSRAKREGYEGSKHDRAPWQFTSFDEWKEYLRKTPSIDYLPEKQREEFGIRLSVGWAHRSHDHEGKGKDLAHIIFGKATFPVKEAFGVSNLLLKQEIKAVATVSTATTSPVTTSDHYLYILAMQDLAFKSSYSYQMIDLFYERLFFDNRLQLRVEVPFLRREHKVRLHNAEINSANRTTLQGKTPSFYSTYNNMEDFITQVLSDNGIGFKKTQEEWGVGDIHVSGLYVCKVCYTDEFLLGGSIHLATAKVRRGTAVWEPELGNEGSSTLRFCGKIGWHRGEYANPYCQLAVGYNFPARVPRRVPFLLTYGGTSNGSRFVEVFPRSLPWNDTLFVTSTAFSKQPETDVRHLASRLQKVCISKGFEMQLRFGNTFERCFKKPLFCGLAYDLFVREKETVSSLDTKSPYYTTAITRNTYRIGHTLYANAGYRFGKTSVLQGEFSYRFAGRNMSAEFLLRLGYSTSF